MTKLNGELKVRIRKLQTAISLLMVVRIRRGLLLFLLCLPVGLGFYSGCSKPTAKHTAGIPDGIVQGLRNARTSNQVFSLIRSINLDSSGGAFLGTITALCVGADGIIVTLDRANSTPMVFDSTGKFIARIGRKGGGPGEFQKCSSICYDDSSRVWYVADNTSERISEFSNDFTYLRSFKVSSFVTALVAPRDLGRLYVFESGLHDGNVIHVFNPVGTEISSFCQPGELMRHLPFEIYSGGICADDGISVVTPLASSIRFFSYDGTLREQVELKSLMGYIPPDPAKLSWKPAAFMASFTSVSSLLRGPYGIIIAQYGVGPVLSHDSEVKPKIREYIAFLAADGTLISSGIERDHSYLCSDEHGNLYSVEYQNDGSPIVKKWAMRTF